MRAAEPLRLRGRGGSQVCVPGWWSGLAGWFGVCAEARFALVLILLVVGFPVVLGKIRGVLFKSFRGVGFLWLILVG